MRMIAAALLLAGCDALLVEKTTFCPDTGAVCPQGLICAGSSVLCGKPAEVHACDGVGEMNPCSSPLAPHGYCSSAICSPCDPNDSWCHYAGWSQMTFEGPDLYGVWPVGHNDVYVSGDPGAVYHYDGRTWSAIGAESSGSDRLISIWASGPNDIFAIDAAAKILHFDGAAWNPTSATFLNAVWGTGSHDVYAVGLNGVIRHYDGTTWNTQTSGTNADLLAIWGPDATHLFIAGTFTILTSNGNGTWTLALTDMTAHFVAVWGTGSSDVYAAANCQFGTCTGSFVRHFNGTSWEPAVPVPLATSGATLTGLWASSDGTPLVTASDGSIFRLTGTTWTQESLTNSSSLTWIAGTASDDVFAVGKPAAIWHYEGM